MSTAGTSHRLCTFEPGADHYHVAHIRGGRELLTIEVFYSLTQAMGRADDNAPARVIEIKDGIPETVYSTTGA